MALKKKITKNKKKGKREIMLMEKPKTGRSRNAPRKEMGEDGG